MHSFLFHRYTLTDRHSSLWGPLIGRAPKKTKKPNERTFHSLPVANKTPPPVNQRSRLVRNLARLFRPPKSGVLGADTGQEATHASPHLPLAVYDYYGAVHVPAGREAHDVSVHAAQVQLGRSHLQQLPHLSVVCLCPDDAPRNSIDESRLRLVRHRK